MQSDSSSALFVAPVVSKKVLPSLEVFFFNIFIICFQFLQPEFIFMCV